MVEIKLQMLLKKGFFVTLNTMNGIFDQNGAISIYK